MLLAWLQSNIATVLICSALIAVVVLIVVCMVRNKKNGKSSCGCGCSSCPMSGECHKE